MSADIIQHPTFGNPIVRNTSRPGRKAGAASLAVERRRRQRARSDPASEAPPNLLTRADQVHAGLVGGLEKALEEARAGRITGAIYCFRLAGDRKGYMGLLGTCCDDMEFTLSHSARLLHYVNLLLDERG